MANKQIKDFGVITDGTGTSILVQSNTTGTYNKISAEDIAAAATVLSKAITAQENVTIQKQLILDFNLPLPPPPPFVVKSTGVDLNNTDAGIIELDFTSDTHKADAWGLKIKDGTQAWGIKADGYIYGHHAVLKYKLDHNCSWPAVRYISNGNNWDNTDVGVFEADLSTDINISDVWGLKIKNGADAWGIKVDGDAILKNAEANSLNSNHINLVDHNITTLNSSSIELGNHGGSYTPASIEIKNSDESGTALKIPSDLLVQQYLNMTAAAAGGVPSGGTYIQVDSLTNPTSAVWGIVI